MWQTTTTIGGYRVRVVAGEDLKPGDRIVTEFYNPDTRATDVEVGTVESVTIAPTRWQDPYGACSVVVRREGTVPEGTSPVWQEDAEPWDDHYVIIGGAR